MADTVGKSPINLGRMGPIQLIPPGFMGLLQLKQLGQLPGDLSRTVSSVIEMRDWYLTANRVGTKALFGPNAQRFLASVIGFFALVDAVSGAQAVVPNGQIWYVEQLTYRCTLLNATDTIHFAPVMMSPVSTLTDFIQVAPDYNDVPLINARIRACISTSPRGFWAFPGDVFGVNILDIVVTTTAQVIMSLRATVLPI